jgi:hypothetical protein
VKAPCFNSILFSSEKLVSKFAFKWLNSCRYGVASMPSPAPRGATLLGKRKGKSGSGSEEASTSSPSAASAEKENFSPQLPQQGSVDANTNDHDDDTTANDAAAVIASPPQPSAAAAAAAAATPVTAATAATPVAAVAVAATPILSSKVWLYKLNQAHP